ncbi:MAG: hypothetical protein ACREJ5_18620 [Geminicoccaceae bacterium]
MSNDSQVVTTASARALASRRNGARSRGPKTAAGKARSSRNALKHGLCAQKLLVLAREDVAAFCTLETALFEELAPAGALQTVLAQRVVSAAWRLLRADRMEAEVLTEKCYADGGLGLALIRDSNGSRTMDTVLRYRGAALAELWRALRTLKSLQAEARAVDPAAVPSARRRARLPLARPNQPEKGCQINALTRRSAAEPRHDTPGRDLPGPAALPSIAPGTKPAQARMPDERIDPRAPDRAHHRAPGRDLPGPAALRSTVPGTKPTRESARDQRLDRRAPGRSAA